MDKDEWIEKATEILRLVRDDAGNNFYPTLQPSLRLRTRINELIGPSGNTDLDGLAAAAKNFRDSGGLLIAEDTLQDDDGGESMS